LYLLARDIARDEHPESLTVVFPNKRAGLFLARELSRLVDRPAWMPVIVTLEEFVEQYAGLKRADEITLVIKLYRAYRECSGSGESFDDFYPWGSMLLEDFDDVDKYLVDARDLFSNLRALHEIERLFPYLTVEQAAHVRRFWSHFKEGRATGREQQVFLDTWEKLYPTYCRFREKLRDEGLCYEGMGTRLLRERLDEVTVDGRLFFAGFNALTKCEEEILGRFRDNGQAAFYWDHDLYYTANERHEAGLFLRENLKRFPNTPGIEHFNNFRRGDKLVEHVTVPSTVGQAKLLPALLGEIPPEELAKTAVVLCDERLLAPVLHSIPPAAGKINVTMGYPARETAAAALVALAGELQRGAGKRGETWYFARGPVVALLDHPLVQAGDPARAREIARRVLSGNTRVPAATLPFDDVSAALFAPREEASFDYFIDIIAQLLSRDDGGTGSIERETLFTLYKRLQQARDAFREEEVVPGERMHARVVGQIVRSLSVPFSGEPLEGMQVMGLLETRMLDFKHLVILSANEGILPRDAPLASFIPYSLRVGFGLPTPGHRDAIHAYSFYRLLQRASSVRILHADAGKGGGEPSRFLYQLKYESGTPPRERFLQEEVVARARQPLDIRANDEIAKRLERFTREGKGLSPSALNMYLDCRLKFYFRHVAGIREKEERPGDLDYRTLGNVFHEMTRSIYLSFPGGHVTADAIDKIARDRNAIEQHARDAREKVINIDDGTGELSLSVVKKYARKVLEHDRKLAPFTILALEQAFRMPLEGNGRVTWIEGNIDRVDRVATGTRVIDYKTGIDKPDFKSIASLFDPGDKQRNKAAFQTILYCLVYAREFPADPPPVPGMYSVRALFAPKHDDRFFLNGTPIDDVTPLLPEFRERLAALVDEIFSPGLSFAPASRRDKCRSCPYNAICARDEK
jgi:CRISPR/Cas system-associated exonuclease Cas4 (RecB family)